MLLSKPDRITPVSLLHFVAVSALPVLNDLPSSEKMRCTCLFLALLSLQSVACAGKTLNEDLSRFISSTKAELARSFFGVRVAKKEVAKVNLSEERDGEIKFAGTGHLGVLFRRSNQNYIANGSQIFQIRKNHVDDGAAEKYFLDSVQEFSTEEGAILFEQTEWKNIFFLAVCYRRNYCRALMSHPSTSITFQQRVTLPSTPTDLQFFVHDEALFLIVAGDPCKIYRWTGTYFDEHEELDTSGAVAVATFRDADATIIVVAQNLEFKEVSDELRALLRWDTLSKVYSKVFVRRNRKTEVIQMLQTKEAVDVVPYSLDAGNETLRFVFVLSNREESSVFWWNGREFSLWKRVPDIVGPGRIFIRKIQFHLFFFFARQRKLSMYHPTEASFDLVHGVELDGNILDVDVREEVDGSPTLLLLKTSDSETLLALSFVPVEVNYVPVADNQMAIDPVLHCLLQLKNLLERREAKLNESVLLSKEIAKKSKVIELKELNIPKVELKSFTINELRVNPWGEKLEATPTEIREKLGKLKEESDALFAELESTLKQVRYRFHGDIVVGRMEAFNIYAKKFNDRAFDLNNIISVTKNQTLSGAIHLKTLFAKALTLPSITGVYVKDVLLRKKPLQAITGEHTVRSLKARHVAFGKLGKLNGTLFSGTRDPVRDAAPPATISHGKTFARMSVAQLEVDYINDEPAEQWLAKIQPTAQDFGPKEEALNFTHLRVTHLVVSNINGMPWQRYLATCKRSGRKGNGSATVNNLSAVHLRAKRINGVEAASLLTKGTPQNVDSTIAVTFARSNPVKAGLFIGGGLGERPRDTQTPLHVSQIIFTNPADISGRKIDFDDLNKTYWMKSWPQEIDTSVSFTGPVAAKDLEATRVNSKPADGFVGGGEDRVEGAVVFEEVTVIGDVAASFDAHRNPDLNHLYNSAVKTRGENRVKGRKAFLGNVSAERISLDSLNGLPFGHRLPTATGIVVANEAEIVGDISVTEGVGLIYLNGRNFNNSMEKYVRLDERDLLQKGNYSSISVKEVEAENVNGIPAANRFPSRNSGNKLRLVIRGRLEVPQLQVTNLNNIALDGYLDKVVLRNGTATTVKGRKSFEKGVTVIGNLDGVLNGYNLTELEGRALSKSKPQDISGSVLVHLLNVNNADAQLIDGVSFGDLLFQDGSAPQVIDSDLLFADFAIAGNLASKNFTNGCDLSGMTRLKVNEIRKLGRLVVAGNVTWKTDREEHKGISYLYGNAVTKHEEQIVEGSLTFRGNTSFDKLTTKKNMNDVDLEFIVKDAIYSWIPVQEIFQDITFRGKITADNILIENNIIVDDINGIDILDLGQRLVRNNADAEIRGKKKFLSGFTAHRFASEAVNGEKTEPIIFCDGGGANGSISFTATTFYSVKTLKDLDVLRVNNVNISNLLEERLTKTAAGRVSSNLRIKAPVSIRGDGGITRINDLNIEDTISISGEVDPISIRGKIEFNKTLSALEKVQVEKLNHRNVKEMKEKLLLNMTDSVIKGSIVFRGDVEFDGNVDALQGVNDCDAKDMRAMPLPTSTGYRERAFATEIDVEIDKIVNSSTSLVKPIVFVDLHEVATVDLPVSKVENIQVRKTGDNVEMDIYGLDRDERCQPRPDCYCTIQKKLAVTSPIAEVLASDNVFPANYKYFDDSLNVEVTVTASPSSRDFRCDDAVDTSSEYATLHWRRRKEERGTEEDGKGNLTEFGGHLRDAKFFRVAGSLFVVMAFHVRSAESKVSGVNIVVHEFDGRIDAMKKVQEMKMNGVEALDLFWTPRGVILVAGNSYDSDKSADSVDSAIYRFSDSDNQFGLLRSVKTHGILDIASITREKESFIFLVQKQSWPFLIFKYNREYDNYYFSQKLDAHRTNVKSNFLSAAAFATTRPGYEGDIFVGVVQSDDGFRLFKYKHIEGFAEEVRQEQRNVQMLMPFQMESRDYLLAASPPNHSVIYELARQGYWPGNSSRLIRHFH